LDFTMLDETMQPGTKIQDKVMQRHPYIYNSIVRTISPIVMLKTNELVQKSLVNRKVYSSKKTVSVRYQLKMQCFCISIWDVMRMEWIKKLGQYLYLLVRKMKASLTTSIGQAWTRHTKLTRKLISCSLNKKSIHF